MSLKDFPSSTLDAELARLTTLPDELLERQIGTLPISVRLRNLFDKAQYSTVRDLVTVGTAPVVMTRGFGATTGEELTNLVTQLSEGSLNLSCASEAAPGSAGVQPQSDSGATSLPAPTLIGQLEHALTRLRPRDATTWRSRMGFDGSISTFDEIADRLNVTRERARQLQLRASQEVCARAPGLALVEMVIDRILIERTEPLWLEYLCEIHELFTGLGDKQVLFGRILRELPKQRFALWPLDNRAIVARIGANEWNSLVRKADAQLSAPTENPITQEGARAILQSLAASVHAPELGTALFNTLMPRLHFGPSSNGSEPEIVAVGRGVSKAVKAVLETSQEPLTIKEILQQVQRTTGRTPSEMAVRNAIRCAGGHVFSRRRYGLTKHSPVPTFAVQDILDVVHDIAATDTARQWSCGDFVEGITRTRPDLAIGLDPYTLNIILAKSRKLQPLGRLIWRVGKSSEMRSEDRRSIADLCADALRAAGKPLRKSALARRVRKIRGLATNFMPQPGHDIARLRPGVWGLISRDFPFPREHHSALLGKLYATLSRRGKALHVTEVAQSLSLISDRPTRIGLAIFGLAQTDKRFRTGRGHLIGLSAWSDLRRYNAHSAIREVAKHIRRFSTPEELYRAVDELAERRVSRSRIAAELAQAGHAVEFGSKK